MRNLRIGAGAGKTKEEGQKAMGQAMEAKLAKSRGMRTLAPERRVFSARARHTRDGAVDSTCSNAGSGPLLAPRSTQYGIRGTRPAGDSRRLCAATDRPCNTQIPTWCWRLKTQPCYSESPAPRVSGAILHASKARASRERVAVAPEPPRRALGLGG